MLRPALDQYFPEDMGVRIIAEPGRYFAASAFTLAVNIIAKRTISASDSTSTSPGILCSPHLPCYLRIVYRVCGILTPLNGVWNVDTFYADVFGNPCLGLLSVVQFSQTSHLLIVMWWTEDWTSACVVIRSVVTDSSIWQPASTCHVIPGF